MSLDGLPIFLVDDDESVRRSLQRLLMANGISVQAFPSALSFLNAVPAETAGILIVDLFMPNMNGLELQEKLNSLKSPLQLIFISAHLHPGDRERAMANGAYGFLEKPFNDAALIQLMEAIAAPSA